MLFEFDLAGERAGEAELRTRRHIVHELQHRAPSSSPSPTGRSSSTTTSGGRSPDATSSAALGDSTREAETVGQGADTDAGPIDAAGLCEIRFLHSDRLALDASSKRERLLHSEHPEHARHRGGRSRRRERQVAFKELRVELADGSEAEPGPHELPQNVGGVRGRVESHVHERIADRVRQMNAHRRGEFRIAGFEQRDQLLHTSAERRSAGEWRSQTEEAPNMRSVVTLGGAWTSRSASCDGSEGRTLRPRLRESINNVATLNFFMSAGRGVIWRMRLGTSCARPGRRAAASDR